MAPIGRRWRVKVWGSPQRRPCSGLRYFACGRPRALRRHHDTAYRRGLFDVTARRFDRGLRVELGRESSFLDRNHDATNPDRLEREVLSEPPASTLGVTFQQYAARAGENGPIETAVAGKVC